MEDRSVSRDMRLSHFFSWQVVKTRILKSLDQHVPPERLAVSFAVGVFCSLLPFPGHTLVVALLSFAFRLNLIATIAGAWLNIPLLLPFTYGFAFIVGELITGTDIPPILWARLLDFNYSWPLFRAYFVPMAVGTTVVGAAGAAVSYVVVLRIARQLRGRRFRRERMKEPSETRSSEEAE